MRHTAEPDRGRKGWWVLVALLLVAGIAAGAFVLIRDAGSGSASPTGTATPSAAPVRTVASFSGSRGTTTRPFGAAVNWQVRWTAPSGSGFSVELLNQQGASLGTIVTAGKRASGATFVSQAGTFKLKVTSKKPWRIQVLSRPTR